jgi:hypothetical protein
MVLTLINRPGILGSLRHQRYRTDSASVSSAQNTRFHNEDFFLDL